MKKVMAFGTFDIFHPGHESYLRQAKKLGDFLTVVVARDRTVRQVKKHSATNNEKKRKLVLEKSALADKVVLGNLKDKYAVVEKYRPAIIALGYDQQADLSELKERLEKIKNPARICRLKSWKSNIFKSSKIKKI